MNRFYSDIISRIPELPKWFDEHAVPRYEEFTPDQASNIYAIVAVLALIQCQSCKEKFKVCFTYNSYDDLQLSKLIHHNNLFYGDPPNMECCPSGPTMSSDTLQVLEYWSKEDFDWVRDSSLEIIF